MAVARWVDLSAFKGHVMDKRFLNQLVVVTGAASGIGKATAENFVKQGATVIAIDRDANALHQLVSSQGRSITALVADVAKPAFLPELETLIKEAKEPFTVLVNNAGIGGGGEALATSDQDISHFLDINVVSLFRLSRFALQHFKAQGSGAIVNLASIYAEVGATNSAGYSASKAAVAGITRQLATDYGVYGIRVNAVAPGLINTPLTEERIRTEQWRQHIFIEQSPLRRVGEPDDVAKAILFLASEDAAFISGEILRVDGGWAVGRYPREKE